MTATEGATTRETGRRPLRPRPGGPRGGPPGRGRHILLRLLPVAVLVVAAVLRLASLDHPPRMYFDEVYYAEDGLAVVEQGVEERRPAHPPLGPILVSLGIRLAGPDPVGWRLAAAVAGTAVVALTYPAARRLGASGNTATLAMLLVAVDGLALTMSRIAMLDAFLSFFVMVGFLLLVAAGSRLPGTRGWGWRLAGAGAAFGLAVAVKWSGGFALAAAVLVAGWQLVGWARRTEAGRRQVTAATAAAVVALAVVPAVAYVASHAGWFANFEATVAGEERCPGGGCDLGVAALARVWWEEQLELVDYHRRLPATHPYRSPAWSWPLLARPVLHYFEECPKPDPEEVCVVAPGQKAKILGVGNPALWWPALAAVGVLAWRALRERRGWAGLLLVFLLAQFLPWLFVGKDGYLFYMTPLVPFLALAVALGAAGLGRHARPLLAGLGLLAVVVFVYLSPIWFGVPLAESASEARMWLPGWR